MGAEVEEVVGDDKDKQIASLEKEIAERTKTDEKVDKAMKELQEKLRIQDLDEEDIDTGTFSDPDKLIPKLTDDEKRGLTAKSIKFWSNILPKKQSDMLKARFKNATPQEIDFFKTLTGNIDLTNSNWAIVTEGEIAMRMVPFTWQEDIELKHMWAVFLIWKFYGQSPWKYGWAAGLGFKNYYVAIPFTKSLEYNIKCGTKFLSKFDATSEYQIPIYKRDSADSLKSRLRDRFRISKNLQAYRTLSKYTKPRWDVVSLLILAVIILVVVCAIYLGYSHWTQIQHFLNSFTSGQAPAPSGS